MRLFGGRKDKRKSRGRRSRLVYQTPVPSRASNPFINSQEDSYMGLSTSSAGPLGDSTDSTRAVPLNRSATEALQMLDECKFNENNPETEFEIEKEPFSGQMSNVFFAKRKSDDKEFAVKKVRLQRGSRTDKINGVRKEFTFQKKFSSDCCNIVKILDVYLYKHDIYLVTEYIDGRDIKRFMKKVSKIPECYTAFVMKSILTAVNYLHKENKLHRELTTDNFLISTKMEPETEVGFGRGIVKLCGFGSAMNLTLENPVRNTRMGDGEFSTYIAPEMWKQQLYARKVDIWMIGMSTLEMVTGVLPKSDLNARKGKKKNPYKNCKLSNKNYQFSETILDFINNKTLNLNSTKRKSAETLLRHPFIEHISCQTNSMLTFINNHI